MLRLGRHPRRRGPPAARAQRRRLRREQAACRRRWLGGSIFALLFILGAGAWLIYRPRPATTLRTYLNACRDGDREVALRMVTDASRAAYETMGSAGQKAYWDDMRDIACGYVPPVTLQGELAEVRVAPLRRTAPRRVYLVREPSGWRVDLARSYRDRIRQLAAEAIVREQRAGGD